MDLINLIKEWETFNTSISDDENFDDKAFAELYGKSEETLIDLRSKTELSKDELILFFELARFVFKEIYTYEQDEWQERIRKWMDQIMYLPPRF